MKIAFFSVTGQTRRFVKKLGPDVDAFEITPVDPLIEVTGYY